MPDIADGESVEMQGSGSKPYQLKNVGGVYSCSCPAWRNQSIGIERRTCKHLRKYRGDAAEEARIGGALPAKPIKKVSAGENEDDESKSEPPLLLAESWDNSLDLSGWWMSEKLDGVRAYWDGRQFLSRQGNLYHAPDWFIEGLPDVPLDGELWIDRKAFQRTVSVVRRQDKSEHWKNVRYIVFDAPTSATTFEDRVDFLKDGVRAWQNAYVTIHEHMLCRDVGHLREELQRVEALGGEGLMLRQPQSKYVTGRSSTLLKVKTFHDAEAVVLGHEPGKGRHQGRLGALAVQLPNGKKFSVGTGFSDKQREQPPAIGSLISFRYQELSNDGIPRFPSYVGVRSDVAPADVTPIQQDEPPAKPVTKSRTASEIKTKAPPAKPARTSEPTLVASRYFECVDGKSNKFWEISTVGNELTTRWGRIGTKGQSKTKKFSSTDAAWAERNATIADKLAGGYKEIEAIAPNELPLESNPSVCAEDAFSSRTAQQSDSTETKHQPAVSSQDEQPPSRIVPTKIEQLVWAYFRTIGSSDHDHASQTINQLDPVDQIEVVKACFILREQILAEFGCIPALSEKLLTKRLPFSESDIEFLTHELARNARECGRLDRSLLAAIEHWIKEHYVTVKVRDLLRIARDHAEQSRDTHDVSPRVARIDALIGEDDVRVPIKRREVWGAAVIDDLAKMPISQRTAWIRLLHHCVTATSGKPSASWTAEAKSRIAVITRPELLKRANQWLPLVDKPWPEPRIPGHNSGDPLFIVEGHQDILRGLVWCCCFEPDAQMARTIGALGISAYRKIRFVGARAVRVGNACVYGLGVMGDSDAVAQLAILKVKVKFGTAQRFIAAELDKAAERLGLPREELEEMSVPAYGLDEVGLRHEPFGDFTAELTITSAGDTQLRWLKADGKEQKSIPAAVQKEFADELKELKAAAKDIDKMLPIQRERIDSMFLQMKSWPLAAWRDRYLNHPLIGTIARRIIWQFRTGKLIAVGIFHQGQLVDCNDRPLTALGEDTTVELWHPIGRPIEEIVAWRSWFERHEVQQPFKQAHREVYVLTDAETRTDVYSNRFAAHILRQSQFRALASTRAWQSPLLGYWDGGDCARAARRLPQWNLFAEFWIVGIPPDANDAGDDGMHGSAGMPYISTDQVRFCRVDNAEESIPLEEVPPLVFSEIMRDVDLFVGVASVGNNPDWSDGGPNRQFADYWHQYSFGDLSATARTRFDVLERLLPRLKIADRCSLADRFLIVRGDLRTYKIHLGSGNILMLPNDEYLCIIPKPNISDSLGGKIFLPFDGDRALSIILSKAFLVAEDTKIKDQSITRQIALKPL